jgi:subtilisin family serine protease
MGRGAFAWFVGASVALAALDARADAPNGASLLRVLGPRAEQVIAPVSGGSGRIGALVALPPRTTAKGLGLEPLVAGFGRLHGSAADIVAFAGAHPALDLEVAPPVHMLLNQVQATVHGTAARARFQLDGSGVLVGVADTGLDVGHPDLRDPVTGSSRVAWILDLSLPPAGIYPDLEAQFGVRDSSGNLVAGAVLQGTDIDRLLAAKGTVPIDEVGHGTHVTSIAAGNGGPAGQYVGMAPNAQILFARIGRDSSGTFEIDDLVTGVAFLFNRADAMHEPVAVNLSLGTDFGPHDGTLAWEQALAAFVGSSNPGHVLTVAAGNSGSVAFQPGQPLVHNEVFVQPGGTTKVPIVSVGSTSGSIEVWVATTPNASLSVGLDGPDGQWIPPVPSGGSRGKTSSKYVAGITNGSSAANSQVPSGSNGAIVIWSGTFPAGEYDITLEGHGTADLYVEAVGDAAGDGTQNVGFAYGVREKTINLPATHPMLLGVGSTANRALWTAIDGVTIGTGDPLLDAPGGLPLAGTALDPFPSRDTVEGEVSYFSSAGPTVTGVPKPELSAPGGSVIAAMSEQATPGVPTSVFTTVECPLAPGSTLADERCLQIDPTHAVLQGTSMAAPEVAGTAALLLERDPTLTQAEVVAVLQAGAHAFRVPPPFEDQPGAGELDVEGALEALEQMADATAALPGACASDGRCPSWIMLSADHAPADASTQVVAIVELRTAGALGRADLFDPSRLSPVVLVGNAPLTPPPVPTRKAPGVWTFPIPLPPGLGGQSVTVGAAFDGVDVVTRKTIPIATDAWSATYATSAGGSCSLATGGNPCRRAGAWPWGLALLFVLGGGVSRRVSVTRRRSSRSTRAAPRSHRRA